MEKKKEPEPRVPEEYKLPGTQPEADPKPNEDDKPERRGAWR